ncbi:MAG: trans-4-hydroxy-L-proline dehydratase activase [Schaedlerella sp.]|nr:trans-4-hydroxy-L-proline dehydratase activase [Schaedlerella sp.]
MSVFITNIQKYSIHDGDGIRTTVFFKGCPLRCRWCHNPETQFFCKQLMVDFEKCTGCGNCISECPEHAVHMKDGKAVMDFVYCTACGICTTSCLSNIREVAGKEYTVRELIKELAKDEMFYEESGGGVTLSGGEVMCMDIEFIEELVKGLNRRGITVTIDTCGFAPYIGFKRILPYVDTFLYDVKLIDNERHREYTGVYNTIILRNLKYLSAEGARIYIRIPVIKGVNADQGSMKEIAEWMCVNKINAAQVNLLPYHNTGSNKYNRLGMQYEEDAFETPSKEEMESFVELFKKAGFHKIKIGG